MKTIIVIVTVALTAVAIASPLTTFGSPKQKVKGIQYSLECGEQHGVPVEERKKLKEGDFANHNSEKHQCFVQCFLEKGGFIKGGELQENVVLEKLPGTVDAYTIQIVFSTCKNEKGANDCETAFKFAECIFKNKAALQ